MTDSRFCVILRIIESFQDLWALGFRRDIYEVMHLACDDNNSRGGWRDWGIFEVRQKQQREEGRAEMVNLKSRG